MKKQPLVRFSVSMPADVLEQLDAFTEAKGYGNRSHTVKTLVRERLVEHQAQAGTAEIAGTVTLVYDHHKRNIQAILTDIQHDYGDLIVAAMHVHLSHHACMEVLAVRGAADPIKQLAERLITIKGVKHGKLTITTTAPDLELAAVPAPPRSVVPRSGSHTRDHSHRRPLVQPPE